MPHLHPNSTLIEVVETLCEGINGLVAPRDSVDQFTFTQKMDELKMAVQGMNTGYTNVSNIETHLGAIAKSLDTLLNGDDDQLMDRLRAKVKANYADHRSVLQEFATYIREHGDGIPNEAVDDFLEQVERDDSNDAFNS
jgi:hypothetical protein